MEACECMPAGLDAVVSVTVLSEKDVRAVATVQRRRRVTTQVHDADVLHPRPYVRVSIHGRHAGALWMVQSEPRDATQVEINAEMHRRGVTP